MIRKIGPLVYDEKTFKELEKAKEKKGLSWENFFLWAVENS